MERRCATRTHTAARLETVGNVSSSNIAGVGASLRLPMASEIDPSKCPTCGEPNACGLSQGKSECWCFSALISSAALERVPSQAKNLACICERCAAASTAETKPS